MRPRDHGVIVQVSSRCVSQRPAPVGLLRRQARRRRVHRIAARRAAPRAQQRPGVRRRPADDEHAAVRLGQEPAAPAASTGPACLPTRGRRQGDLPRRPPRSTPDGGRRAPRRAAARQPGWGLRRSAARATTGTTRRGSWASRPIRRGPRTLWAPVRGDHGAHGRFGERARSHSVQLWADMNRSFVALAAATLAAGVWIGVRTLRRRV